MEPNIKLEPNLEQHEGNKSNSYVALLGELQFLANTTRPDVACAVNKLVVYTGNPSLQHVSALKRILCYLAGTKSYGITYQKPPADNPNLFYGYTDTMFTNTDNYKSTSGYVFLSGGGAITWRLKKQTTIALSLTEAEYVCYITVGTFTQHG